MSAPKALEPVANLVERLRDGACCMDGPVGSSGVFDEAATEALLNEAAALIETQAARIEELEFEHKVLAATASEAVRHSRGIRTANEHAAIEEAERLRALLAEAEKALAMAAQFIENGVEMGYVRMPTYTGDPAHDTLPAIRQALAALKEQTP